MWLKPLIVSSIGIDTDNS